MSEHLYTHRKTSYQSASIPQHSSFQPRPLMVQPQTEEQSEQPDIKTAVQRAERYGHRLDHIKFSKTPAPAQIRQIVQAKLTIGEPGDKYEQEADRVADQVVNSFHAPTSQQSQPSQAVQRQEEEEEEIQAKPEITALQRQEEPVEEIQAKPNISDQKRSPLPSEVQQEAMPEDEELQTKPILQRREAIGGGEASTDVESAINSARGGGQPLDEGLQRSMGQAMGADFSGVKVHTDAQADQLNQSIQAKAFTTGQDVFFRSGEYNPGSRGGQELIAHELTHVVQQNCTDISSQDSRDLRIELMNQPAQSSTIQAYLSGSTNNLTVIQRAHTAQLDGNRLRKIDQLGQSQLQEIWDNKDVLNSQRQTQDAEIVLNPDENAGGIEGLFKAVKTRLDLLNQKTQPFNVRGRAEDPPPMTGILITENQALARIAWKNKVQVVKPQNLTDPNTKGIIENHIQQHQLKLIKEGPGYQYHANPYGIRIPREDASPKTGNDLPRGNHNGEYTTPVHILNKPAQRGNESEGRDSAMGGFTARNYAIAAKAPREEVENTQWEWLHLIASSLGGNNEVGNLVAGTFDGNTRMIPWEQAIVQLSQEINENDPKTHIRVYAKCMTHENTWLAFTVKLLAENSDGIVVLQSPEIDVYKGIVMDKLEYDIESYIADMQVTDLLAATKHNSAIAPG